MGGIKNGGEVFFSKKIRGAKTFFDLEKGGAKTFFRQIFPKTRPRYPVNFDRSLNRTPMVSLPFTPKRKRGSVSHKIYPR